MKTLIYFCNLLKVPVSLKMMVKRAKKHKKYVNSSSEESENDEHYDSDSSAQVDKSDSNSESGQVGTLNSEYLISSIKLIQAD